MKSSFIYDPSARVLDDPRCSAAIAALASLAAEDPRLAERVVSVTLGRAREQRLIAQGVRRVDRTMDMPPHADHMAQLVDGNTTYLRSENYGFSMGMLESILTYCHANHLDVSMSAADAIWFPSKTIAVDFVPKSK